MSDTKSNKQFTFTWRRLKGWCQQFKHDQRNKVYEEYKRKSFSDMKNSVKMIRKHGCVNSMKNISVDLISNRKRHEKKERVTCLSRDIQQVTDLELW